MSTSPPSEPHDPRPPHDAGGSGGAGHYDSYETDDEFDELDEFDDDWQFDDYGVTRYVWRPEEIPSLDGVSPELVGRRVALLGIGDDEIRELTNRLERNGAQVVRIAPARGSVRHPCHGDLADSVPDASAALPPLREGDVPVSSARSHAGAGGAGAPTTVDELTALLIDDGRPVDGIIDLGVGTADVVDATELWAPQFRQTLDVLRIVAPAWSQASNVRRHFYAPVLRTGGYLGTAGHVENPHGGMWAGLAKGLPRELPNLNLRIVDFAADVSAAELAEGMVGELYRWGLFEVGRVGPRRFTPSAQRTDEPTPTLRLSSSDTVLLSGGGRGIGFELALDLARGLGVRVVVTGRGPEPDPSDEILALTDEGFARYRTERLRQAGLTGTVRAARRQLDAIAREREVVTNLERARDAGARVEYRQCDVTDANDVDALVAELSGSLAVVVHNAGFDAPARLAVKSNDDAEAIIRVKLDGMLNLLAAVDRHADPDVFSVVGSLTGRWGGMVGQLDYGAANEAVSYFARWASTIAPAGMSIHALAWPTWERLGMVSNYEATLAYMAPMPVVRGIELWRGEILGRTDGEIAFHAEVGPALTPNLVRGYSARSELPGMIVLGSVVARCGEVSSFATGQEFATRVNLARPGDTLHLDVTADGAPAVPISVLIDQLTASAAWVVTGAAPFVPVGIDWLGVDIPGLARAAGRPCDVVAHRIGRHAAPTGQVDLVTVTATCGGELVASADIRFALDYPATLATEPGNPNTENALTGMRGHLDDLDEDEAGAGRSARLAWRRFAFDLAPRNGAMSGRDRLRDMFAPGPVAVGAFGYNVIESLVALTYPGGPVRRFWLEGLAVTGPADPDARSAVTVTQLHAGPHDHAVGTEGGANVGAGQGVSWNAATHEGITWLTAAAAGFEPGHENADDSESAENAENAGDTTHDAGQEGDTAGADASAGGPSAEQADAASDTDNNDPDNPADVREFA
ncbi:MAG: SDR family NAD(P)-dependent oxidoreductase [Dermatophilus congolensis]|nr:SDR family NAD(P)-dependent oxidoreductase [Dermatophilus congolensis]